VSSVLQLERMEHVDMTELVNNLSTPLYEHELKDSRKEGLGRLPATLTDVGSVLLFNTSEVSTW